MSEDLAIRIRQRAFRNADPEHAVPFIPDNGEAPHAPASERAISAIAVQRALFLSLAEQEFRKS